VKRQRLAHGGRQPFISKFFQPKTSFKDAGSLEREATESESERESGGNVQAVRMRSDGTAQTVSSTFMEKSINLMYKHRDLP
jgi:hypothetical protein